MVIENLPFPASFAEVSEMHFVIHLNFEQVSSLLELNIPAFRSEADIAGPHPNVR